MVAIAATDLAAAEWAAVSFGEPGASARQRINSGPVFFVAYLRAGKRLMVAPGPVRDVLAANAIIGTLEILTDGTFAWPSDLAHYIERHHAQLPGALLEHARTNGFAVPPVDVSSVEL